jgi:hypothetical protein
MHSDPRDLERPLRGDDTELDTPSPLAGPEMSKSAARRTWAPLAAIVGALLVAAVVAARGEPPRVASGVAPLVVQPALVEARPTRTQDSAAAGEVASAPDREHGNGRMPALAQSAAPADADADPVLEDQLRDDPLLEHPADEAPDADAQSGGGGGRGLDLFGDRH